MSEVTYAVVYFYVEDGRLYTDVYHDNVDLQHAEDLRLEELEIDPDLDPQMIQVIQYNL